MDIHWPRRSSFHLALVFIWDDSKADLMEITGKRY